MKCPKYIKEAIKRRANAAQSFLDNDLIITSWCNKKGIDTEYIAGYVECVSDPYGSVKAILNDIERVN